MIYAIILISGALYRIPRGGGLGEGRSLEGALIWAVATSAMLSLYFWSWWPMISAPFLMLGETQAKSDYWPGTPRASWWKHCLQGSLILNPVMGIIYHAFYWLDQKFGLPSIPNFIDGYTAWSELASGFVTASALTAIIWWAL